MSLACTSCIVIPGSIAAAGQTTAVPSKNPMFDLKPGQAAGRRFGSQPIGPLKRYD